MEIKFLNYWAGNSFKVGNYFPVNLVQLFADINPSCWQVVLTILGFGIYVGRNP